MALTSMTGFARAHGISGSYAWAWELKSVNGKGLDLRLRMPSGWDAIEAPVRARAAERLARGSIQAALTVDRSGVTPLLLEVAELQGGKHSRSDLDCGGHAAALGVQRATRARTVPAPVRSGSR